MRRRIKLFLIFIFILCIGIFIYFYLPPILSDAVYPLEYRDWVKKYSQENNLNPNYVAGVIFSESRFRPNATSPVGARGLMQIMPPTGLGIAKHFGEEASHTADKLYDPETNIRYGCWYLGSLVHKYAYDGTLPLIAYNGGVGLADRYAVNLASLNPETSYYVIKVKKNEQIYNQLYGEWWAEQEKEEESKAKKPTLKDLILSWMLGRD